MRLVSLMSQKFINDVAADSMQHTKVRVASSKAKKAADKKLVATVQDVSAALTDAGVNVAKPAYYADRSGNNSGK